MTPIDIAAIRARVAIRRDYLATHKESAACEAIELDVTDIDSLLAYVAQLERALLSVPSPVKTARSDIL